MQIIVLGMHRSGTSAVTRLINLMGAYFGPEGCSTGQNAENPKGFWERRDVRKLNDALLASLGCDWHRIHDFDPERVPSEAAETFDLAAGRIVFDLDLQRPWVIKEPRLCLLLPHWKRHLECPVAVLVQRGPFQVARSLEVRNGFPRIVGIALWERYLRAALAASEQLPRTIVRIDELMADPVAAVRALHEQFGRMGVTGLRIPDDREVLSFLEPALYHHRQEEQLEESYLTGSQHALALALRSGQLPLLSELPPVSPATAEVLALFEQEQQRKREHEREEARATRAEQGQLALEARLTQTSARALLEQQRLTREHETALQRVSEHAAAQRHLEQLERHFQQVEREAVRLLEWGGCLREDIDWLLHSNSWRTGDRLVRALQAVSGRRSEAAQPARLQQSSRQLEKQLAEAHRRCDGTRVLLAKLRAAGARCASEQAEAPRRTALDPLRRAIQGVEFILGQLDAEIGKSLRDLEGLLASRRWRLGSRVGSLAKAVLRRPAPRAGWAPEDVRRVAGLRALWASQRASESGQARRSTPEREASAADISAPVTILLTIYNAYDEVRLCLAKLLEHTSQVPRILLLDDASPDTRMRPLLESYARADPRVELHRSETNLGYTRNVNRGCRLAQGDVVLLNSDTQVSSGWLRKLRLAAISQPKVATVTAVSNAAGAFSVPERGVVNALPEGVSIEQVAGWVERLSEHARPAAPTGNGFCMYVTRAALNAVGEFDEQAFPRGYGEENDFCMRASAQGFVHLVEDSCFVYHSRSASFGAEKEALIEASRSKLRELHPEYKPRVEAWLQADVLGPLRQRLALAFEGGESGARPEPPRATILYLCHDGQGGTRFTSEDLMREVAKGARCLMVRAGLESWTLLEWLDGGLKTLAEFEFSSAWQVQDPLGSEREGTLLEICARYRPDLVHVRHLIGSSPEILPLLKRLEVPTVFSFHDFYTVCPTIQLIDDRGTYCAGTCTAGSGECPTARNWFRKVPPLKHAYVLTWQARVGAALECCDRWVTTSAAARSVIVDKYPALDCERFRVIEHGRDLRAYTLPSQPERANNRVAVVGALGRSKGIRLLERLLEINAERGHPFEFHFLGSKQRDFEPEKYGAIYHGAYKRSELPRRLQALQASFGLIASIWPETYCHALTESWAAGLTVFASDIGTLRDRVRACGGGWLFDPTDPLACFEKMLAVLEDPEEFARRFAEMTRIRFRTVGEMASSYLESYAELHADAR